MIRQALIAVGLLALVGALAPAGADEELTSTRALGMGDALRAAAVGAAGIHLNPSGLTLIRGYVVEGGYTFLGPEGSNDLDVSIADSATARIGAGVYFDYVTADARDPTGVKVGERSGYESGVALAFPFGETAALGIEPKFQSIDQPGAAGGKADGFTIDVGGTARPVTFLNLAVVGTNLVEQNSTRALRTLGLGAALNPIGSLLVDFDVVFDFDSSRLLGKADEVTEAYHLGGEMTLAQRLALRAGYIHDGARGRTDVAFGASVVTPQLAIDFGGRKPVDGPGPDSALFGVSIRLFLQ